MKKLALLLLLFVASFSSHATPSRLVSHCVFMTYNISIFDNQFQGSGIYCIEWFWRTGTQPTPGEEADGYLDVKAALGDSAPSGSSCTMREDKIITVSPDEGGEYKFKIPAGIYTVNDEGHMTFKATVIE